MTDETTDNPPVTPLEIEFFKQNHIGDILIGGNNAVLSHGGDTIELFCPPTISKVKFHTETRTRSHMNNMVGGMVDEKNVSATKDYELTTGQTVTIGPVKEQEWFWAGPDKRYIDDQNIFVTLQWANDLNGKRVAVSQVSDYFYYWHIFTPDESDELARGMEISVDECKTAIKTRAGSDKIGAYHWTVTDYSGRIIDMGDHKPEPFDFIPWIIGGIVILIIAAVVYWFFLRGRTIGGYTFGKPAPAPAPVQTAPSVVVVPTTAPAPAPAPAPVPTAPGGK